MRAVVIAALLLVPTVAGAQAGISGRLSTYATGRALPSAGERARFLRFIQLVDLDARPGAAGLTVHASFWAAVDAGNRIEIERPSGDVSTLYVRYVAPAKPRWRWLRGVTLTLGRQLVVAGPNLLEQVDGAQLAYTHPQSGVQLVAFGGAPSGVRLTQQPFALGDDSFNYRSASWVAGGRLGYLDVGGALRGGVSYVQRRYGGDIAQQDISADASLSLLRGSRPLSLSALGTVSLEALALKEVRASADFRPWRKLDIALRYQYSRPDLWVPRTSIFSVFSDESFQEAAADIAWRVKRRLRLRAAYGRRFYGAVGLPDVGDIAAGERNSDERSGANRALLELSWGFLVRRWGGGSGRLVARVERLEAPDANAYNRLRLAAALPTLVLWRPMQLVADIDMFVLDQRINGVRFGLLARAFVQVALRPELRLLVGGGGGISPLMSSQGSFLVRLSWQFSTFKGAGGRLTLARRLEQGRW